MGAVVAALTEEAGVLDIHAATEAYGDGALDDHGGMGATGEDLLDDALHGGGVEEVETAVVVGGGGYNDEVGITVGRLGIERSYKVELALGKVLLYVLVLDGRHSTVDHVDLGGDDIYSDNFVVL